MAKNTLEKVFALQAERHTHDEAAEKLRVEIGTMLAEVTKVHGSSFGPVTVPGYAEKQYVNIRTKRGVSFMCFRNESEGNFGSWLKGKKRSEIVGNKGLPEGDGAPTEIPEAIEVESQDNV